jgi:hypothetical protein
METAGLGHPSSRVCQFEDTIYLQKTWPHQRDVMTPPGGKKTV